MEPRAVEITLVALREDVISGFTTQLTERTKENIRKRSNLALAFLRDNVAKERFDLDDVTDFYKGTLYNILSDYVHHDTPYEMSPGALELATKFLDTLNAGWEALKQARENGVRVPQDSVQRLKRMLKKRDDILRRMAEEC